MSRTKAKPRRVPEPPVSYLDGMPMKLSDAFRRPPRVALPFNVVVNDLDNVLRDFDYDFSLEESVVRNAEEQRRIWKEAEKKRKDQEEAAAAKRAKEEAEAAAAAAAAAANASESSTKTEPTAATSSSSTSSTPNANNNSVTATRPAAIRTSRPEVPARPHPSSLPSPLLREVTAEKILQPKTLESARNCRPPASVISTSFSDASSTRVSTAVATTTTPPTSSDIASSSPAKAAVAAASTVGAASAFNVADWERCEDPFEIMERRTINVMDELKSVLESASSARTDDAAENAATSSEAAAATVGVASTSAGQPSMENQTRPNRVFINAEASRTEVADAAAESSSAEAEVLSNVERPPSYDEVVGDDPGASRSTSSGVACVATTASIAADTVVMSIQNLQVTPSTSSPSSRQRSDISSPSTPTSSGANSFSQSFVESPVADEEATSPKAIVTSSPAFFPRSTESGPRPSSCFFAAATPTTPTASYPEYVSLPDFPSLSEADLPANQRESTLDDSDLSASGNPGPVFADSATKRDDSSENVFSNATASQDSSSPRQNSYDKLSGPLRVLVDKLVDMGFDVGVTSRAAQHFGADEKQVIDHLCAVSILSEEGHGITDAEEALLFNEGKEKLARKFLKALAQLRQFGFEDAKIKAALVASGNDTDKALDQLMVT